MYKTCNIKKTWKDLRGIQKTWINGNHICGQEYSTDINLSVSVKLICQFNVILIKIPNVFFFPGN